VSVGSLDRVVGLECALYLIVFCGMISFEGRRFSFTVSVVTGLVGQSGESRAR
jgi:hypothetical protein